jgi:hypothetical protein
MKPALALAALLALASCAREERVIGQRSLLGGLPGAQAKVAPLGPKGQSIDPAMLDETRLVEVRPDGTKRLISRSGRHLMLHIWTTLQEGDAGTFVDQVLSRRTRDQFLDRGLDPAEAFERVRARLDDVQRLFARMPMGEHTPGVHYEQLDRNTFRFILTDTAARGLTWIGIDMIYEDGNYRLLWFVSG